MSGLESSNLPRDHDYDDHVGEFALLNIVLRKLSFLPARRDDENILRTEGDMVRQRNERYIELLVTRGKGRKGMTQEERAESDKRIREVEAAIASKSKSINLTRVLSLINSAVSMQHEQKGEQAESKTNISKDVKAKKGKEREKKEKEKGKGKGKEKENEKEKKKMK